MTVITSYSIHYTKLYELSFGQASLQKIVAVSPLIDPITTTVNLQVNHPVYHRYFVNKWQRSLKRKLEFFPDLGRITSYNVCYTKLLR